MASWKQIQRLAQERAEALQPRSRNLGSTETPYRLPSEWYKDTLVSMNVEQITTTILGYNFNVDIPLTIVDERMLDDCLELSQIALENNVEYSRLVYFPQLVPDLGWQGLTEEFNEALYNIPVDALMASKRHNIRQATRFIESLQEDRDLDNRFAAYMHSFAKRTKMLPYVALTNWMGALTLFNMLGCKTRVAAWLGNSNIMTVKKRSLVAQMMAGATGALVGAGVAVGTLVMTLKPLVEGIKDKVKEFCDRWLKPGEILGRAVRNGKKILEKIPKFVLFATVVALAPFLLRRALATGYFTLRVFVSAMQKIFENIIPAGVLGLFIAYLRPFSHLPNAQAPADEEEMTAQSGVGFLITQAPALISAGLIYMVFGRNNKPYHQQMTKVLTEKLTITSGIDTTIKSVVEMVKSGAQWMLDKITGNRVQLPPDRQKRLAELVDNFVKLQRRITRKRDLTAADVLIIEKLYSELLEFSKTNFKSSEINTSLLAEMRKVTSAWLEKKNFNLRKPNVARPVPIGAMFSGDTGIGKSTIIPYIASELATTCRSYGDLSMDFSDPSLVTYTVPLASEFPGDSYYEQPIAYFNDMFQVKNKGKSGLSEEALLFSMQDTAPFEMNCSDVANKGKRYFTSEYVLATTNSNYYAHMEDLQSDEAYRRRWNWFELSVDPKYYDKSKRRIDSTTFPPEQRGKVNVHIYRFRLLPVMKENKDPEVVFNFDEMVAYLKEQHKKSIELFVNDQLAILDRHIMQIQRNIERIDMNEEMKEFYKERLRQCHENEKDLRDYHPVFSTKTHNATSHLPTMVDNTLKEQKAAREYAEIEPQMALSQEGLNDLGPMEYPLGEIHGDSVRTLSELFGINQDEVRRGIEQVNRNNAASEELSRSVANVFRMLEREQEARNKLFSMENVLMLMGLTTASTIFMNVFLDPMISLVMRLLCPKTDQKLIGESYWDRSVFNQITRGYKKSRKQNKGKIDPRYLEAVEMQLRGRAPEDEDLMESARYFWRMGAESAMLSDDTAIFTTQPRTNVLRLIITVNGQRFFAGSVLAIGGTKVIMPLHYMLAPRTLGCALPVGAEVVYRLERAFDDELVCQAKWEDVLCEVRTTKQMDEDRDVCMIDIRNLGCNHTMFKDIRKHIVSYDDLNLIRKSKFSAFIPINRNRSLIIHHTDVANCLVNEVSYQVNEGAYCRLTEYVTYDVNTMVGDCGTPVYADTPRGLKIIGFHVAGRKGSKPGGGYGNIITQEVLDRLEGKGVNTVEIIPTLGVKALPEPETLLLAHSNVQAPIQETAVNTTIIRMPKVFRKVKDNVKMARPARNSKIRLSNIGRQRGDERTHYPARLNPYKVSNEMVNPAEYRIRKFDEEIELKLDERVAQLAFAVVKSQIYNNAFEFVDLDYDFEQCMFGDEGMPYLEKLPNTSMGHPFTLVANTHNKSCMGTLEEYRAGKSNAIRDKVKNMFQSICWKLETDPNYTIDPETFAYSWALKDELLSKAKVFKPRLFAVSNIVCTLVNRKYFLSITRDVMWGRIKNGMAIGLNPYGADWALLKMKLDAVDHGGYYLTTDFSSFDSTQTPELHAIMYKFIDSYYASSKHFGKDEGMAMARKKLFEDLTHPKILFQDNLYEAQRGLPSGHFLTIVINSFVSLYAHYYSWLRFCEDFGIEEAEMHSNFTVVVCGDDAIGSVGKKYQKDYNFECIERYMAELGLKVTGGKKDAEAYQPEEEAEFLKRRFRKESGDPYIYAPLAEESIFKMGDYYRTTRDMSERDLIISNAEIMLMEWTAYGEEHFKERAFWLECQLRTQYNASLIMDFHSWRNKYKSTEIFGRKIDPEELVAQSGMLSDAPKAAPIMQDQGPMPEDPNAPEVTVEDIQQGKFSLTNASQIIRSKAVERDQKYMFLSNMQQDETLERFFEQPRILSTATATPGDDTAVFRYSLSYAEIINFYTPWSDKLRNLAGIRMQIKISVTIVKSAFQAGYYRLQWVPFRDALDRTYVQIDTEEEAHAFSIAKGVELNLQESEVAELTVPFVSPYGFLGADGSAPSLGEIQLVPWSAVRTGSSSDTDVVFVVRLSLMEAEFGPRVGVPQAGSTATPTRNITTSSTSLQPETESSRKEVDGAVSIGNAITRLFPQTEFAVDIAKGAASLMGFANERESCFRQNFAPSGFISGCNYDTSTQTYVLEGSQKYMTTLPPSVAGHDVDEMSFDYICGKPFFLTKFTYGNATPGDTLYELQLGPLEMAKALGSGTRIASPFLSLANVFEAWRSDFVIELQIVQTAMHGGQILVAYNPQINYSTGTQVASGADFTYAEAFMTAHEVVNLAKTSSTTIELPYGVAPTTLGLDSSMGLFKVFAVTPLRTSDVITGEIEIIVKLSAKNVMFRSPSTPRFWPTSIARTQAERDLEGPIVVAQSGMIPDDLKASANVVNDVARVVNKPIGFVNNEGVEPAAFVDVHAGVLWKNVRQLLRYPCITTNGSTALSFSPFITAVGSRSGNPFRFPYGIDMISYFSTMFAIKAGPVRIVLRPASDVDRDDDLDLITKYIRGNILSEDVNDFVNDSLTRGGLFTPFHTSAANQWGTPLDVPPANLGVYSINSPDSNTTRNCQVSQPTTWLTTRKLDGNIMQTTNTGAILQGKIVRSAGPGFELGMLTRCMVFNDNVNLQSVLN